MGRKTFWSEFGWVERKENVRTYMELVRTYVIVNWLIL